MSICAIIISYHPSEEIIDNINILLDQVGDILIVDNGSGPSTKELFGKLKKHQKINIIYNEENIGIAAALNIGVNKAKNKGYEWVITFDQDSLSSPQMIENMLKAYDAHPMKEKVVSLSPKLVDKAAKEIGSVYLSPDKYEDLPYIETQEIITSGNMLKLSIFDTVGYFNELLFIDYVDVEFCFRCITRDYKILKIKNAVLFHNIGFPTYHKLLWKTPIAINHGALRRYYIARNATYTFKSFIFIQPIMVLNNAFGLLKNLIIVAIFENNRKRKLTATLLGIFDGIFNRMGKCKISI
ncbi:MAG: glycosyltransferase family 2 protein [Methylococcaceae bacterium]|nr:glycosyltransferase family 2 protein [Methylococcaceae bacterium]MDZ4156083.1 glycosyltransferase family 2 protein [Methylococcales bacterium]MDP2395098.1 glycosyltransferase family 2 protein [Methylococcaceae bacterium]MDP3018760.1 glycosyltransferase family 2 protein [Methylococcaceae bacterium]MDP3390523.1 glycosyltransferase family 2 protein [Methylococcaceae bacterium]